MKNRTNLQPFTLWSSSVKLAMIGFRDIEIRRTEIRRLVLDMVLDPIHV